MADLDAAAQTQLRNITAQTGRTVEDFTAIVAERGPLSHGQIIALLKSEHGLTHGNANLIAHRVRQALDGGPAPADSLLDAQYRGAKAELRPVHDRIVAIATGFGPDVGVVIQKTGVSLRRKKQFAVIGAPAGGRIALGLNLPATPDDPRVSAITGMCSHGVDVRSVDEVDDALAGWLRVADERAG